VINELAELAPILWTASHALRVKHSDMPASAGAETPHQLTISIVAPLKEVQVTISPTSTAGPIVIPAAIFGRRYYNDLRVADLRRRHQFSATGVWAWSVRRSLGCCSWGPSAVMRV